MTQELYYIRNKDAGYSGNALIWWGKNCAGYTAYINGAGRYTKVEADDICRSNPHKNVPYKCSDIDARLHYVFDHQDLHRMETGDLNGWGWPYAERKHDKLVKALKAMLQMYDHMTCDGLKALSKNEMNEIEHSAKRALAEAEAV